MGWWLILILMVISALGGASVMGMILLDLYEKRKDGEKCIRQNKWMR